MKLKSFCFILCFLLLSGSLLAQTVGDIMNQTQGQRTKQWGEKDERKVMIGMYADYLLDVGAKLNGDNAFLGAYNFGLKVNVPLFASGDGSNMGDDTGDLTFSGGYNDWLAVSSDHPDLTSFSGTVGFRLGLSDLFFIEPQVGYSYGSYQNNAFKTPAANVSGVIYNARIGITILKGIDIYGIIQSGNTKQFGSPIGYGFGASAQF